MLGLEVTLLLLRLWLLLISYSAKSEAGDEYRAVRAALAGRWIQVHPQRGASHEIVLSPSGQATGVFDLMGHQTRILKRWQIGTYPVEGMLCLGGDATLDCQGFSIRGDTLALANINYTIFVRAPSGTQGRESNVRQVNRSDADVQLRAPRVGERVRPPRRP